MATHPQAVWSSWPAPPWPSCGYGRRWSWTRCWRCPCRCASSSCCWARAAPTWTTMRSAAPSPPSCPTRSATAARLPHPLPPTPGAQPGSWALAPCPASSLVPVVLRQQFHEAAYLADEREDLLTAINAFLDCSVVLPPSEVQGEELLRSVAHFQRQMLKKREEQGRLLPPGAGLEPKSAQDKGTGPVGARGLGRAAGSGWGVRREGWWVGALTQAAGCSAPADGRGGRCSGRRSPAADGPAFWGADPRRAAPLPPLPE